MELLTPTYVACEALLQDQPEILEILPLAGRLRLRLQAGVKMAAAVAKIRETVTARDLPVTRLQAVVPELEDVFRVPTRSGCYPYY